MKRLVLKVGTQPHGLADGMLVCTLDPAEPVSRHMQTVFALVDVPDTWDERIVRSLRPVGQPQDPDYRARAGYVPLRDLAWALGDPTLECKWRSPFVVAPRNGLGLFASLLQPTAGVGIAAMPDRNAVTQGTFTVGTGGDYATWGAAAADVGVTQTDDLLFLQITNTSEMAAITFAQGLNTFLFLCSSCEPPWGAPEAGFVASLDAAAAVFTVTPSGGGTVEIERLYLRATVPLGGVAMLTVDPTNSETIRVHDNLLDGQGFFADGLAVGGQEGAPLEVWNNQVWDLDGVGYDISVLPGTTSAVVENNTAYLCLGGGFVYADDVAVTLQNCAAFDSVPGADFTPSLPAAAVTATNASSDGSAPGPGSLTGLASAVEYVTLVDTNIAFLKVAPASSMTVAGTVALIAGNTTGHRGNAMTPTPTIGADEFLADLYVTLGNCAVPRPVLLGAPVYQGIITNPTIIGTAAVLGAFPITTGIPNLLTVVADLLTGAGFTGAASLTGTIAANARLVGTGTQLEGGLVVRRIVDDTLPEGRRRLGLTPRGSISGQRTLPTTPLLVHAIDVLTPQDVEDAHVPVNGHFLVSAAFQSSGPGDPFGDHGAKGSSLGSRRQINPIIYTFREGFAFEVVWFIAIDALGRREDRGLYRFEPDDEGAFRWVSYRSLPQRALDGQLAFEFLDPDRIYDYYAKLLGIAYFEWQRDTEAILDFTDARTCPERLLNFLGGNFGLTLTASDPPEVKRARIATAIPTFKAKAQENSYLLRLRALGFLADVREVWVDPEAVDNWEDEADAPAAIQADIAARGLTGLIDPDSGQKGQDYIFPPHGFHDTHPVAGRFYPSSRLALFLNRLNGAPLSVGISDADLTAIRNRVAAELRDDLEPLHVDIRFFGTRFTVADGQDTVELTDALTFSNPTTFPFHAQILLTPALTGRLKVSA